MEEGKRRGGARTREERKKEQMEKIKNVQVPESEGPLSFWRLRLSRGEEEEEDGGGGGGGGGSRRKRRRRRREAQAEYEKLRRRKRFSAAEQMNRTCVSSWTGPEPTHTSNRLEVLLHRRFSTGKLLHVGGVFRRKGRAPRNQQVIKPLLQWEAAGAAGHAPSVQTFLRGPLRSWTVPSC